MNKVFVKTICLLLIFGLLLPSLSMAALTDFATSPDCKIKNILRKVMEDIGRAIKKFLASAIKATLCKVGGSSLVAAGGIIAASGGPVGAIIGGILSGLGALFSRCGLEKTQDAPSVQLATKELIYDVVSRCVAFGVLQQAENSILELARKGSRDGDSTWVRDWRNFQLNAQYRGEEIFRGVLKSARLCNYFENDIDRVFGAERAADVSQILTRTDDFDSFQAKAGCTLPPNFDFNAYKQNFFGNGGWEAWSRLLEPQNNYYGTLFLSLDEANKQRAIEKSADINQVIAGRGFTGISGTDKNSSCLVWNPNKTRCLKYKDINTPGSVIAGSIDAVNNSTLNWIVSSDEFNDLIGDLTERLVSRLANLTAPDKKTPVELLFERAGGDYVNDPIVEQNPDEACINNCYDQFCPQTEGGSCQDQNGLNACIDSCLAVSGGGGGGGGVCRDPGGTTANYGGDLRAALDAVIAANPNGIADALNTTNNSFEFLGYVVAELQSAGFNSTTNIKNGNDNPNSGDLIALWRSGDTAIERYDVIRDVGATPGSPNSGPLREKTAVQYTGDIPLSCAQ